MSKNDISRTNPARSPQATILILALSANKTSVRQAGPGLRPGAVQPRRLASPGGTWSSPQARNSFLIFALRKSTKMKKKSASADAQFPCAPSALMENQPSGWFSPLLPFVHSLRSGCRSPGKEKGKTIREDGLSHERPKAAEYFARCGERLFFCFS